LKLPSPDAAELIASQSPSDISSRTERAALKRALHGELWPPMSREQLYFAIRIQIFALQNAEMVRRDIFSQYKKLFSIIRKFRNKSLILLRLIFVLYKT
jgi:hypothetical protein